MVADGARVDADAVVARVSGSAHALLTGERVALNFLSHMSGIATLTRRYVDLVEGTGARIADTRKTTPGLRAFEKYAVRCGGGQNHRSGLFDAILIKDNHIVAAGGIEAALTAARAHAGHMVKIEIEVTEPRRACGGLEAPDRCRAARQYGAVDAARSCGAGGSARDHGSVGRRYRSKPCARSPRAASISFPSVR